MVVLSPWAVPRPEDEVVVVELVLVELDATGLEQAARTTARMPTATVTPRPTGGRKEL